MMLRAGLKAYIPSAEIYSSTYIVILLLLFNFILKKNLLLKYRFCHLNKMGKRFVIHQLASFLHSIFKHKISVPISLSWPNVIQDNNIPTCEANQMKLPNRNSSRNRKLPITRSNDFLW